MNYAAFLSKAYVCYCKTKSNTEEIEASKK